MVFKWSPFPFLRFVLALIAGILVSIYFPQQEFNLLAFIIALGAYIALFLTQKLKFKHQLKPVLGVVSVIVLFLFGHILTQQKLEKNKSDHLYTISQKGKINGFVGSISEPVKKTEKSLKTVVSVERVKVDSNWVEASGKILCYFGKDSTVNLKYADRVIVGSFFNETENPKNPAEFDYKQYLAYHNIHHRGYVKKGSYKVTSESELSFTKSPNFFIYYAQKARAILENRLMKHFKNKREYGIAQALILGVKDDLENEVVKAYSGVGAMHVLAVSGLHVGLVYQVFLLLFGWLGRKGWTTGKYIQAVLLLTAIWAYAFVTGLSPSVMRAATMFTFITIAKATGKHTNIYNTLSVSAFLLLCLNPFMIVEVGFQLSYFAVLGIVYIQPKLARLFTFNNWLGRNVWEITCVSIAAQIGTFPLGLLYFHQFPTYFFISNLVVIPAAVIILYWGIVILVLSWVDVVAETLTFLLENVIWGVNEIIFALNKLPHALLSGIDISIMESWLIYITLFFLLLFFYTKKLKLYLLSLVLVITISAFQFEEFIIESQKKEMIFYSVNGHLALGLRDGENMTFISDDSLSYNTDRMQFHVYHHWWKENILETELIEFENIVDEKSISASKWNDNILLFWNGKKIFFYDKPFKSTLIKPIEIDYLVIRNNPWIDKKIIDENIMYKQVLIDGTNKWKTANWVKKTFSEKAYNLNTKGALVIEM